MIEKVGGLAGLVASAVVVQLDVPVAAGDLRLTILEAANRRRESGIGIAILTRSVISSDRQMRLSNSQGTIQEVACGEVVVVSCQSSLRANDRISGRTGWRGGVAVERNSLRR